MIFFIILLMIWSIIYNQYDGEAILYGKVVPVILDIIDGFKRVMLESGIEVAMGISLIRLIGGYLIACIVGIVLGGIMVKNKRIANSLKGPFLAFQTLPNVCLVPIVSLLYGASEKGIIILIVLGTAFGIALGVENSISSVDKIYIKVGKTMGLTGAKLYRRVIIPAAIPNFIVYLKTGWSFAWRALMSGEVINSTIGIGLLLKSGQKQNDIIGILWIMLLIIVIGVLINKFVFEFLENKINEKYGIG
ncbi:MAG: ABC transporter permease [Clostridium sp.]